MRTPFERGRLTVLGYSGLIYALGEVILRDQSDEPTKLLLEKIKERTDRLGNDIYGLDSSELYFGMVLDVSRLKKIIADFETGNLDVVDSLSLLREKHNLVLGTYSQRMLEKVISNNKL
jgi:hypothetical protein